MRLFPISDLHLERRALADIPALTPDFDVLVCAGDVWEGEPERGLRALVSLADGRPLVVVPGNHEHYRRDAHDPRTSADLIVALEAEASRLRAMPGAALIHVLRNGHSASIGGVRFIGATLWSDWALAGRWIGATSPDERERATARAIAELTDPIAGSREFYGAIRKAADSNWTPADVIAAHARDRARLYAALRRANAQAEPAVVVTHYPPIATVVDLYRDAEGVPWWLPAFYATTLLDDLPTALRPAAWISGHFHAGHDLLHGATRCVANPVEGATFNPGLVVEIGVPPSG